MGELRRVRFLEGWRHFNAGERAGVMPKDGEFLVSTGRAIYVDEDGEPIKPGESVESELVENEIEENESVNLFGEAQNLLGGDENMEKSGSDNDPLGNESGSNSELLGEANDEQEKKGSRRSRK